MFYRIKNGKIYDYADFQYDKECLYSDLCTMKIFEENRDNFYVQCGELFALFDIEEFKQKKRQAQFEKDFFKTSLGWIRRKVSMKDGSVKDFLSDLLLPIKAGLELGQEVRIITYKQPDFSVEFTKEYMQTLQVIKPADENFVQECLYQTVCDFGLTKGGSNGFSN